MSGLRAPQGPLETVRSFDEATLVQRRRLEQELHDGPALRLAALALRLGLCSHQVTDSDQGLRQCLDDIQAELHVVLQELRTVAGRIYPPVLAAAGLGPALETMVEHLGLPIRVCGPEQRYSATVEAAAYFAIADRLLSLGSRSSIVTVTIRSSGEELLLEVSTDGEENVPVVMRVACA